MNSAIIDRIRGTIFGHAVGDALGLGTEFLSKSDVARLYPHGLRSYEQIFRDGHRGRWATGDWTDDTDQMLCILDSLLERNRVDINHIAQRLKSWMNHGFPEFGDSGGMGIGRTVLRVLNHPNFFRDPHGAAEDIWNETNRSAAANGGVMRTSVLGVYEFTDILAAAKNAEDVCKITHFDPRCVASCVAVSVAISLLIYGEPVDRAIKVAVDYGAGHDRRLLDYVDASLEALALDEGLNAGEWDAIGYTFKSFGAGFWALKNATSYLDGILAVIHEGGDADTNASVAGALLGASFGIGGIPPDLLYGLKYYRALEGRVTQMIDMMQRMEK